MNRIASRATLIDTFLIKSWVSLLRCHWVHGRVWALCQPNVKSGRWRREQFLFTSAVSQPGKGKCTKCDREIKLSSLSPKLLIWFFSLLLRIFPQNKTSTTMKRTWYLLRLKSHVCKCRMFWSVSAKAAESARACGRNPMYRFYRSLFSFFHILWDFFSFMPLQIYRLYYGVKRTDLGFIRPFEISNEHPSKVWTFPFSKVKLGSLRVFACGSVLF